MLISDRFNRLDAEVREEFLECIRDLNDLDDVKRLADFPQHMETNRLDHSFNVALHCFLAGKRLGFDYRSASRAGLLHDLFHYDWTIEKQPEGCHAAAHPRVALRNARKNVKLNKIEENAILRHMWPLTITPPRYKESLLLSFVDKYCCMMEIYQHLHSKTRTYINKCKIAYSGGSEAK